MKAIRFSSLRRHGHDAPQAAPWTKSPRAWRPRAAGGAAIQSLRSLLTVTGLQVTRRVNAALESLPLSPEVVEKLAAPLDACLKVHRQLERYGRLELDLARSRRRKAPQRVPPPDKPR